MTSNKVKVWEKIWCTLILPILLVILYNITYILFWHFEVLETSSSWAAFGFGFGVFTMLAIVYSAEKSNI